MTFEERMAEHNAMFDKGKSDYYNSVDGLERRDDDTELIFEIYFDEYEGEEEVNIITKKNIDFDSEKGILEEQVIFQVNDKKYFMTVTEFHDSIAGSKIYPVTSEKEIKTIEYTIDVNKKNKIKLTK